jgi:uncharacterized membrane protein
MILDDEVFAVIMAIVIIGSVLGVISIIGVSSGERFTAIGLLNEECKIGSYPAQVNIGSNLTLCLYVYNHMDRPIYYKIIYKVGSNNTLPTNTSPSSEPVIDSWKGLLNNNENLTMKVEIPVRIAGNVSSSRVALIFELWIYDIDSGNWIYTGRWVHLYVSLTR